MINVIKAKYDKIVNIFIKIVMLCILFVMILLLIHRIERKNYTCISVYLPDGTVEEYDDITHIINKFNGSIEFTSKEGLVMTISDNYIITRERNY